MRILFIHQNFPGQFLNVAQTLRRAGSVEIRALTDRRNTRPDLVATTRYQHTPKGARDPLAANFLARIERGRATAAAMLEMRHSGFCPDVVIGHFGWGETLFVKDVFPKTKLILHAEFFYRAQGADIGFDPKFPPSGDPALIARTKNAAILSALADADYAVAPTRWQASLFPRVFAPRIAMIHEGIDTTLAAPAADVGFAVPGTEVVLRPGDEVVTFVNRNLEPYRGYHILMRALPEILTQRPNARVVIVGGDETSYGAPSPDGRPWRTVFLDEVHDRLPLDRVHFVGKVSYPKLLSLLQVSAAHVYLTYPFVLSWSLLDAMSTGALVIASDTAPVREVIKDGENGILFDFFDVVGLSKKVIGALADPSRFAGLRAAARKTVVEGYDAEKCTRKWLTLIDLAMSGATPTKVPTDALD